MKRLSKKIIAIVSAVAMVVTMLSQSVMTYAAEPVETAQSAEYEIYPTPHEITYAGSNFVMSDKVNVVYEEGIDADTKARLDEVLALQKMTATTSQAVQTGEVLNILVGIKGSEGYVDEYVNGKYTYSSTLFDELDSYYLAIDNGTIVVLGKDTDAAFYGLTSLYHIFTQVEGGAIENLQMEDYADVASRGFIEGYYGNPWSTEDRCNLMEWGGYYKLNSYFYAPKDDPKHNAKWRELYTEEEIANKVRPLAEAGNKSKCRFVYALHPYMNNAIRYSSEAAYQEDLAVMQAKFTQVIEAGVRQIAILADDAANVGGSNYVRTLNDMTAWIKEMQKTYPDLKLLLPFCTQEYMYNGESYYSQFPENIQIVMTGGRVWGECSDSYTTTFKNNVGRGVYLWINWPCTDNSKKHLIMGGYSTFLHPGVNPDKVQGIVLNPMQQSEPSKVAIFGNACYTWNIWETADQADQAWEDSFAHVDHKSYKETAASEALKELSKHMINQNMDSRVTALQESVVLKDELNSFKAALEAGTVTKEAVDSLIEEFEILQNASVTYRNEAGDANIRDQIVYWLNCWDDTTAAAIAYLNAINAYLAGNDSALIEEYFAGQAAFSASKTYGFHYVDHTEYAEVGVQHIVPFIKEMGTFLATEIKLIVDPNALVAKYISNRYTTPASGDVASALDGNDGTSFYFTDPLYTLAGDYIGVSYNRGITVNSIRILMGGNKNQILHSKLQYLVDEENAEWTDIPGAVFERTRNDSDAINVTGLELKNVKAVRLIATADNLYTDGSPMDSWLEIKSIDINKGADAGDSEAQDAPYEATVTYDAISVQSGNEANYFDGDASTEVWLAKGPYSGDARDKVPAGGSIVLTFAEPKAIGRMEFAQGASAAGDIFTDAKVQYKLAGTENWVDAGTINNAAEQTIALGNVENVSAVRIYNNTATAGWVRVGTIRVYAPVDVKPSQENVYTNVETTIASKELTGANGFALTEGSVTLGNNDYVGIKLDSNKELVNVAVAYTEANANVKLQASKNGIIWTDIVAGVQTGLDARYVRLVNTGSTAVTLNLTQFTVEVAEFSKKLHSCDVAVQWSGDTRESMDIFDGNMGTGIKIDGGPLKGQSIVYDLGQSYDINSLRIYVIDSEHNYIRDAVVQVSSDLSAWTDLFKIGDGVTIPEEEGFNLTPRESFPNNDSNYPNYVWAGNDELNASGRYLRILFTADCTYRGAAMNEIMINGGKYVSVESNKDFQGTLEVQGHLPSYMTDGDLLSSYKPSEANGSMTYHVSANQDAVKALRVIQSGTPSNATVTMSVYDGAAVTEVEVGKLSQALNEFAVPEGKTVLSITISWKDVLPEIMEIIHCATVTPGTGNQPSTPDQPGTGDKPVVVNKAALATAITTAEALKAADYTAASYAAVQTALTAAKTVNAKADATQAEVDAAVAALNTAVKALVKAEAPAPAPQPEKKPLAKGKKFTANKVTYKVIKSATKNAEVSYVKNNNSKAATITVPKTVKYKGFTYKVTAIEKNAFKKNGKIKKVVIGDNVKTIGASAFEGCKKLTNVTIGKSVNKIDKNAFKSCGKLATITIKATNLKSVGKNAFKGIKSNAKIKVPAKKYAKYKTVLKNKGQGKKVKITK